MTMGMETEGFGAPASPAAEEGEKAAEQPADFAAALARLMEKTADDELDKPDAVAAGIRAQEAEARRVAGVDARKRPE